jgi:hypothetical protein
MIHIRVNQLRCNITQLMCRAISNSLTKSHLISIFTDFHGNGASNSLATSLAKIDPEQYRVSRSELLVSRPPCQTSVPMWNQAFPAIVDGKLLVRWLTKASSRTPFASSCSTVLTIQTSSSQIAPNQSEEDC